MRAAPADLPAMTTAPSTHVEGPRFNVRTWQEAVPGGAAPMMWFARIVPTRTLRPEVSPASDDVLDALVRRAAGCAGTSPFKAGDLVTWRHVPRCGWGYVFQVPATVVHVGRARVTIDAELDRGGVKRVAVLPGSLEARK